MSPPSFPGSQGQVEHSIEAMVAQRVFGIALGYEDLVDDDQLRHDPVLATVAGRFRAKRYHCHCYLPLYVFCGRQLCRPPKTWARRR